MSAAPSAKGGAQLGTPYREWLSLDELRARGAHVALADRTGELTYRDLADRARAVAAGLTQLGVRPGQAVGLFSTGRSFDEAVGLVGILAQGAVAIPLDAGAPVARLAGILGDRRARAVVADQSPKADKMLTGIDSALERALSALRLDERGLVTGQRDGLGGEREDAGALGPLETELACYLHTSGSTGRPKPVPITWAGLDAFTAWGVELTSLAPGDRVLRVAELIFDLAWFDHLATLRAGATLCLMSRRELAAGRAIVDALEALRPTVVYGVPSMFMKVTATLTDGVTLPTPPRVVLFAGEVFPPSELLAFSKVVPDAALYNLYGPTETNVCTFYEVHREDLDGEAETPIGIACPYAACELRDEADSDRRVDGPGLGELWVSGPSTMGGGPLATRDRVERGDDGLFYFRGRIDRMVKVRGYRVDPGEVEAALCEHPAVRQAAVVAVDDAKLGHVLRGFAALGKPDAANERALRKFLSERLPGYMVPDRIVTSDDLPRTATGKIDYAALTED